jgi:putative FmdB family regulatory protein
MPYYEFECTDCGEKFDVMLSYEEHDDKEPEEHCPSCDSPRVGRLAGSPAEALASKSS